MIAAQVLKVPGVSIIAILPELILCAGGLLILVGGAFLKKGKAAISVGAFVILTGAGVAAVLTAGDSIRAFADSIVLDGFAAFVKIVLVAAGLVSVLTAFSLSSKEDAPAPELVALMLFATAGMMLMASAADLILLFLALETFSLALYVLTGFRRRRLDSQEGALKYFLTGSFSSAFFLYGVALLYGGTGTTRLAGIAEQVREVSVGSEALIAGGLALLLVGLFFKIAAVPFHMWTPDAYQGAPSPITGFMAAGAKIAGFAALLRLLVAVFPSFVWDWRPIVTTLSVITMVVGSFVAIVQTNVKRMLAYSSIAHSGFVLIGVVAANSRGVAGALFYLGAYAMTILGAFAVVYAVGRPGEEFVELSDYKGLGRRRPFLAWTFTLFLVSLAGIPPTAGFFAKLGVFTAAVAAGEVGIVVVAGLASAVAAFFYGRIIWLMFFEEPAEWDEEAVAPSTAVSVGAAVVVTAIAVVLLGFVPGTIIDFAADSFFLFR